MTERPMPEKIEQDYRRPGPRVVFYKDTAGEWRWRYVAANGRTMADSAEGYTERNDASEAAAQVFAGTDTRHLKFVLDHDTPL